MGHPAGCPGRGGVAGGRDPALALVLVFALALGFGVGCAARRPAPATAPALAPVLSPSVPGQDATQTVPGTRPLGSSDDAFPPLPGTNRVYPSQDPRNQAASDAPEAFPSVGAAAGSVATDARTEPVVGGGAPESIADDAIAEPVAEDSLVEASVAVSPPPLSAWSVQLLASSSLSVARERAKALTPYFSEAMRVEPVAGLFKVRVGRCATRGEAEALRRKALDLGLSDAFVVPAGAGGEPPR